MISSSAVLPAECSAAWCAVFHIDANWRFAKEPTLLQSIGRAIDAQQEISALRFPSAAARLQHKRGWNVAIYRSALVAPDRVEILSNTEAPLEVIP